jgi:hypothetical protein
MLYSTEVSANIGQHLKVNVVAKGGTVRWNWHITPDLCLATSHRVCTI